MNPFDWRGPDFLVFYFFLGLAVVLAVYGLRRRFESGRVPGELTKDPYQIAFLRGGPVQLITVAIFSLIDRGLLEINCERLRISVADAAERVQRPIDRAILDWFQTEKNSLSIYEDEVTLSESRQYAEDLQRQGLLPDEQQQRTRRILYAASLVTVVGVAGSKILVALARGHYNVGILLVAAAVLAIVLYAVCCPRLTSLGREALAEMKNLFHGLKARGSQILMHNDTNELVYLAAVFGLSALPVAAQAAMKPLNLVRPQSQSATDGTAGCSSCGATSSCGGGGGGCGGGGCGGGCGGCGS
jgi:uncharacterized protein (TIGR04222 family)